MRSLVRTLLAASLGICPAFVQAAPRSIDDCEKIEAADAYNRCLASFGPPARSIKLRSESTEPHADRVEPTQASTAEERPEPGSPREAHGRAGKQHSVHGRHIRHWHKAKTSGTGRSRMVFSVVSGRTRIR